MHIDTPRFVLRDFEEGDLGAFLGYQADPRYRELYDLDETHARQAADLFARFLAWRREEPRRNRQVGVFARGTGSLRGCAGLRGAASGERHAVVGIELVPDDWGRHGVAVEVATALVGFGFRELGLDVILGSTSSGNARVERLARWFGAEIVARRAGPDWMTARGQVEVE